MPGKNDHPIITADAQTICSDVKFDDASGSIHEGTKDCTKDAWPACAADGAVDCVTNTRFKAVDMKTVTAHGAKIDAALVVAGVAGALRPCATDGATDCVANTAFKAVDISVLTTNSSKISAPLAMAGVVGTLVHCTADGIVGCIANSSFKAADMSRVIAGNVRSGVTIAGVAGAATGAPGLCSADGAGNCIVDGATYKAAHLANLAASSHQIRE